MEERTIPSPRTSQSDPGEPDHGCRHGRRRRGFLAGLLLGIIAAGLIGFGVGATMPAAEAALGALAHGGFSPDHDGPPTPEEAKEHAEFVIGFALHRLDATDDQEQRVRRIVDGAIDDLFPVVREHRANRDEFLDLLSGPGIDRAAVEQMRAEEMALADKLSRTIAAALADSAEVLTAEQRARLVERLERFHHHH